MKLFTVLALVLLFTRALPAQQQDITPQTPVDSQKLHQWLHSNDPRLIAWSADFAQRTHNGTILAEMPRVLENWPSPATLSSATLKDRHSGMAMAAVLDALIQENAQVPPGTIRAIARQQPAAAALLATRLNLSDSVELLSQWSADGSDPQLARVATMLLAKNPQATRGVWNQGGLGFVADLVATSEEHLNIIVTIGDANHPFSHSTCGTHVGNEQEPGWPPVRGYVLTEGHGFVFAGASSDAEDVLVVDLDGDGIYAHPYNWLDGFGTCNPVQPLNEYTRHRILAYWLGVPFLSMTWQPDESRTIIWSGKRAYNQQRAELVRVESEKLRATVGDLHQRGLLTDVEARDVSPHLIVTTQCQIHPCPLPPDQP